MANILCNGEEFIPAIFEANAVEPLLQILETKNNDACIKALKALINIISCNFENCQRVLDYGALTSMKKLCDRLLVIRKAKRNVLYGGDLRKKSGLLLLRNLYRIIKNIILYGEAQASMIIDEGFIPLILQQISDGMTPEIKAESTETIKNIIVLKPPFISSLINEQNLFSFYYNNLASTNVILITSVLNSVRMIINMFEDKDICRQRIRECGCSMKLVKLLEHSNEDVRGLAHLINEFVNDIKPAPIAC